MKNYKTYIDMLIKDFNDVKDEEELEKSKRLRETLNYFLNRPGVPLELKTICKLMDKYFNHYYQHPKSFEANILKIKIQKSTT